MASTLRCNGTPIRPNCFPIRRAQPGFRRPIGQQRGRIHDSGWRNGYSGIDMLDCLPSRLWFSRPLEGSWIPISNIQDQAGSRRSADDCCRKLREQREGGTTGVRGLIAEAPSDINKGYVKTWSALETLHISSGCYGDKNSLGLEKGQDCPVFRFTCMDKFKLFSAVAQSPDGDQGPRV